MNKEKEENTNVTDRKGRVDGPVSCAQGRRIFIAEQGEKGVAVIYAARRTCGAGRVEGGAEIAI